MALFGKVFEKKECAVCGGEIGLLGNRKLADGNMCKHCAQKLSPWFDGRRNATVEQILAQLEAREENRQKLQSWRHNLTFGEYQKMFVRLENGVPESFVVAYSESYRDSNADIIPFACVDSCELDIRESRSELMQENADGEEVSYNPPRYRYDYDFYIKLFISGIPYIDDILFQINRSTLQLEPTHFRRGRGARFDQEFDPSRYPEYRAYQVICEEVSRLVACGKEQLPYTDQPAAAEAAACEQVSACAADPARWFCPGCGTQNGGNFCSECGAARPAGVSEDWKCFCGTVNTGKFCSQCGTRRFSARDITCRACRWTAEPGTASVPVFCPNCGRRFSADDL